MRGAVRILHPATSGGFTSPPSPLAGVVADVLNVSIEAKGIEMKTAQSAYPTWTATLQRFGACLLLGALLVACAEDEPPPSNPGEACDAGRGTAACTDGFECKPDANAANICQRPLGSECETGAAASYCLAGSACVASAADPAKGACLIEAKGACDATAANPFCVEGTSCVEGASGETACLIPAGEDCDVADAGSADAPCAPDLSCVASEDGQSAQCLIPAGAECDATAPESHCATGTFCIDDGTGKTACLIPLGGECDLQAAHCVPEAQCVEIPAAEGQTDAPAPECRIPRGGECDAAAADPFCAPKLMCAELESGSHACHPHVYIQGIVRDALTSDAIEGAHIIARNEELVAVTDVAISDAEGNYQLELPSVRDADGKPLDFAYTLRAAAMLYETFPGGLRTALPIFGAEATEKDDAWVIESALTEILLLPLKDQTSARFKITGSVESDTNKAGVLVVAKGSTESQSAISDLQGDFTLFNILDGEHEVRGYAADLQLEPAAVTVSGADEADVILKTSADALVDIAGSVQIVNAPGGSMTSVILVVEDTFDENFVRGEAPPGLRAPKSGDPNVTGTWTIDGVPAGKYVILAAFENDDLVRDPDTNIAGTSLVRIEVTPADAPTLSISDSFKITEALAIVSPGANTPEAVTTAPVLTWEDDSSESYYEVKVFNAYGDLVWEDLNVPGVSGQNDVTLPYGGPLDPGMYYQFRVTSWRTPGGNAAPISATEDLKGVFYVAPPPAQD